MADVITVAKNFDLGFQSDIARELLAKGAAYRMRDYIPENEAALRKRGGFNYVTSDLSALSSSARTEGVVWAPFTSDPQLVVIGDSGKLYKVTTFDTSGGSYIGASISNVTGQLFYHKDRVIIPAPKGIDVAPQKWDNAALAAVGGTPPNFSCGASWGDYIIGANGFVTAVRYASRAWWSGAGTPDVWSPSTSFADFPEELNAVIPLRTVILFFGYQGCHLMTGSVPPPGGDMTIKRYYFTQGTFDGRTVKPYRDYVIWANNTGVWRSDGTTLTDLTERGGISLYWQSLVRGFNPNTGWRAAAGVYRGCYFISVTNDAGALVTTLVCDLDSLAWYEFSNLQATMFAERTGGAGTSLAAGSEELFVAWRAGPRVLNISPLWTPTVANASDANGLPVLPVLETPFYDIGSDSLKRFRSVYVTYDLRTAGGTPYIAVEKLTDPAGSYAACPENLLTTTHQDRRSIPVREKSQGVAFRFTQMAASADTRISKIGMELHGMEQSR